MKRFLQLTVLVALMMIDMGSALFAQAQREKIQDKIMFDNQSVANLPLIVEIYMIGSTVPLSVETITTQADGEFAIGLSGNVYPYSVFDRITVREVLPIYQHVDYNIKSPEMQYEFSSSQTTAEPPSNYFEPGAGTSVDNPFYISNLANLRWLSENISAWGNEITRYYYKQTDNIDAFETRYWNEGSGFSPIGYGFYESPEFWRPFMSHFDGGGYLITDLYINRPNTHGSALFGRVDRIIISNVILENVFIRGNNFVGGLAGLVLIDTSNPNDSTILRNNKVSGQVIGNDFVGGLAGSIYQDRTLIFNNMIDVSVTGREYVGGLAGVVTAATIRGNYALGNVIGEFGVGGLIGLYTLSTPVTNSIINCFATGNVRGNEYVGGLVGYCLAGIIEKSYAVGFVNGELYKGGLVGTFAAFVYLPPNPGVPSHLIDSLFDVETIGLNEIVGYQTPETFIINSFGKYTDEMKIELTYTSLGWDFENIWEISPSINGGYPYLRYPIVNEFDTTIPIKDNVLYQNFPNPFNPETTISFILKTDSHVIIDIYNIRGQKVKSLVNEIKTSGNHSVLWNGTNENGLSVSSGFYLYKMQTNNFVATRKMVLLK